MSGGFPIHTLRLSKQPPSVNAMWRAVGGRNILSAEGRAWKEQAQWELMPQKGIAGPCYWRASILVPGSGSKMDIDNNLKGILDALGAAGKTPDDRYLVDLRIRFHDGPGVIINIKRESVTKWATIKKASKSLIKKLAKS